MVFMRGGKSTHKVAETYVGKKTFKRELLYCTHSACFNARVKKYTLGVHKNVLKHNIIFKKI